jgi:hypothetical protein
VLNSAKENTYQRVFTDKFHVSFHKPKEDSCGDFRNLSNPTEKNKDTFPVYDRNKIRSTQDRKNDRQSSISEDETQLTVVSLD